MPLPNLDLIVAAETPSKLVLAAPFLVAAGVLVVAVFVSTWVERRAKNEMEVIWDRWVRLVVDGGTAKGITEDDLKGDDETDSFPHVIAWVTEMGAGFAGYLGLLAANVLLIRDTPEEALTVGCALASAFLGSVALVWVALAPAREEIKRYLGLFSIAQIALILLNVASAVAVALSNIGD